MASKDFQNPLLWRNLKSNQRHRPKQKFKKIIHDNSEQIQRYKGMKFNKH